MSKHLTNFEQSVKKTLEGAELPYENISWDTLQKELDKIDAVNSKKKNYRWLVAAGIFFTAASLFIYFNTTSPEKKSLPIHESTANTAALEKTIRTKNENSITIQSKNNLLDKESPSNNSESTTPKTNTTSTPKIKSGIIEIKKDNPDNNSKKIDHKKTKSIYPQNSLSFAPSTQIACAGTEISFELTTKGLKGSFLWNFGDGNFSNEENPQNVYSKPGVYSISLAVTSEHDGVIKSNTKPVLITITPTPTADFDWEFVSEYNEVPTIKGINKSLNATESKWSINNKDISKEINLIKSFKNKGEYLLSLTATNENGCTNTKYKSIVIEKEYNILPQKTFSPNNDGVDDTFLPRSLRVLGKEFEMSIYSDDQLVYQTNNANKPWDGRLKNGSIAEVKQKFPWVVILYDINGNKQYYSGIVTVVP